MRVGKSPKSARGHLPHADKYRTRIGQGGLTLSKGQQQRIALAHRLWTVRKLADEIVVLDRTGVAEQGPHAELIAQDGWYAGMARLQAVGSETEFNHPKVLPMK